MNTQQTVDRLTALKLDGMVQTYQAVLAMPSQHHPTVDEFMARLVESEEQSRNMKRTSLLLRQSKLRYDAVLEHVQCSQHRNLDRQQLMTLAESSFIDRGENVLITGATGCGKSYLACALGRHACTLGYRTLYFGMHRFMEMITQAKLDGTYVNVLNRLEKAALLIIDDFGLHPLDGVTRLAILQILEDRYATKSTMITSQLPVGKWYDYIGESTVADAIMDRLSGSAHRIDLQGESLRKKK